MVNNNTTREFGTIVGTLFGKEPERGFLVCSIDIEFDSGGRQTFCFGVPDLKFIPILRREICGMFGVTKEKALLNQKCYALRCFPGRTEIIEGIATESGAKFTRVGWAKRMGLEQETVIQEKYTEYQKLKQYHRKCLDEIEDKMTKIMFEYVDWEK